MKFFKLLFLWMILISCTEPFEIENRGTILILDGRISTQIGNSFIRIYQLNEDGSSDSFDDFDIKVVDTEGQEFSFSSLDSITNTFGPGAFGFRAEEGVGYKVIATQKDGITLESEFDFVAESIDFDLNIGDTTVAASSQANEPVFRNATSAIASIELNGRSIFSKLEFEYRYMDFFTRDTIIVTNNDYVLFSCDDNNRCKDIENVTGGFTTRSEWFFILRSGFCDSLASVTQINFVENCNAASMGCCEYRDQWPTVFKLSVEALSKETYVFWSDLGKLTTSNGLIFDTYPFPLEGNVTCDGCEGDFFGLLRASSETVKEQIVIL